MKTKEEVAEELMRAGKTYAEIRELLMGQFDSALSNSSLKEIKEKLHPPKVKKTASSILAPQDSGFSWPTRSGGTLPVKPRPPIVNKPTAKRTISFTLEEKSFLITKLRRHCMRHNQDLYDKFLALMEEL